MANELSDVSFSFFNVIICCVFCFIIPKWLIHDSWAIAIFFEHFWNDQNCDQIRTLGPRMYHQNSSTNTRIYGNSFEAYYFHIREYEFSKSLEGLCTIFEIVEFEIPKLLKVEPLKNLKRWTLNIRVSINLKSWKFTSSETWRYETV